MNPLTRLALIPVALLAPSLALSGEDPRLTEILKRLDDDSFDTREKAQLELKAYYKTVTDVWAAGAELVKIQDKASPEVKQRLAGIHDELAKMPEPILSVLGLYITPGSTGTSMLGDAPVFITVVTSKEMLRHFRAAAQPEWNPATPDLDFSKYALLGIAPTGLGLNEDRGTIQGYAFLRDFRTRGVECSLTLKYSYDAAFNAVGPGIRGLNYVYPLTDLPFTISATGPVKAGVRRPIWKYEAADPEWKDAAAIIQSRNVFAYRKLAGKLDESVSADARRSFLKETYAIDPLLPWIMLTQMARKLPALFREDYQYWKEHLPHDEVLHNLFDAALEDGKKLLKGQ